MFLNISLVFLLFASVSSFIVSRHKSFNILAAVNRDISEKNANIQEVKFDVPLGDGYKSFECSFKPIFSKSEFFLASYDVPFSINIEKPPRGFPAPIVTKAGTAGFYSNLIFFFLIAQQMIKLLISFT